MLVGHWRDTIGTHPLAPLQLFDLRLQLLQRHVGVTAAAGNRLMVTKAGALVLSTECGTSGSSP